MKTDYRLRRMAKAKAAFETLAIIAMIAAAICLANALASVL